MHSRFVRPTNAVRARRLELLAARRAALPPPPPPPPVAETTPEVPAEDELASQFFSSHPPPAVELTIEPELEIERRSPVSPARRARFVRVVKVSVAACALLCIAALVRVAVAKGPRDLHASSSRSAVTVITPRTAPAVAEPAASPPASATPTEARWTDATTATRAAVAALELHRVDAAIEAASAATVLDPADGSAWLVLGAAYQDKGRMNDAVGAYRACTTQGRVDPRDECSAMLRSLGKP